jgi:carbon storage regulator
MLVLARKLNETIQIGDKIEVMVVDIQNGVVKLGINAPRDVQITRKELIPKLKFDQRVRQARLSRD